MSKRKSVLDANILLRFLVNDVPDQADRVEKLLGKAPINSLVLPDLIIAEMIYVLLSVYELSKDQVVEKISTILAFPAIDADINQWRDTLALYRDSNVSIIDAFALVYTRRSKFDGLYSFDKGLQKLDKQIVLHP